MKKYIVLTLISPFLFSPFANAGVHCIIEDFIPVVYSHGGTYMDGTLVAVDSGDDSPDNKLRFIQINTNSTEGKPADQRMFSMVLAAQAQSKRLYAYFGSKDKCGDIESYDQLSYLKLLDS